LMAGISLSGLTASSIGISLASIVSKPRQK
jgi:hypothetical protein